MAARETATIDVLRVGATNGAYEFTDILAVEEPLEIRVGLPNGRHQAVSITMRTPGNDAELVAGFLFTEGIIRSAEAIGRIRHCGPRIGRDRGSLERAKALNSNTIRVDLAKDHLPDLKDLERHFYATSSCGICGKASIESLRIRTGSLASDDTMVSGDVILSLPARSRAQQSVFELSGGLHASTLFNVSGEPELTREDVGRHNALDKLIGRCLLDERLPLAGKILLLSGRVSFELVQKALMAGIPVIAAIGAPSSLAVELAREYGMTLIGFVRNGRFNVYCGEERLLFR